MNASTKGRPDKDGGAVPVRPVSSSASARPPAAATSVNSAKQRASQSALRGIAPTVASPPTPVMAPCLQSYRGGPRVKTGRPQERTRHGGGASTPLRLGGGATLISRRAMGGASARYRDPRLDNGRRGPDDRHAQGRARTVPALEGSLLRDLGAVEAGRPRPEDLSRPRKDPRPRSSLLPDLFAEWERWVADVLETHMSYPILALFRSPHDDTSWVTSLGSVLDAATLILTAVDDGAHQWAKLLYGTGVHAVEDLFHYLRLEEREAVISMEEFRNVLESMQEDGYATRPLEEAYERFTALRARYAPRLDAMSTLLATPPGLWIGDRSYLGARTAH